MKIGKRFCHKCKQDFPTMELELIPSTEKFCQMCYAHVPNHIPREQHKQFLEGGLKELELI